MTVRTFRNGDEVNSHGSLVKCFLWQLPSVFINCGASVCILDEHFAEDFSISAHDLDFKKFRKGDAVLLCADDCPAFDKCPLVEGIIRARKCSDIEELIRDPVSKGEFVYGEHGLPGVDDRDKSTPGRPTKPIRLKALVVLKNGHMKIVVPPMLSDLEDGEDRAEAGDNGSDGRKPGENN